MSEANLAAEAEKWSRMSNAEEKWRPSACLTWRSQGSTGRICTEGKIAAADLDSEGFGERLLRLFEAWAIQRPDLAKAFVSGIYGIGPNKAVAYIKVFQRSGTLRQMEKSNNGCARWLVLEKGY